MVECEDGDYSRGESCLLSNRYSELGLLKKDLGPAYMFNQYPLLHMRFGLRKLSLQMSQLAMVFQSPISCANPTITICFSLVGAYVEYWRELNRA